MLRFSADLDDPRVKVVDPGARDAGEVFDHVFRRLRLAAPRLATHQHALVGVRAAHALVGPSGHPVDVRWAIISPRHLRVVGRVLSNKHTCHYGLW